MAKLFEDGGVFYCSVSYYDPDKDKFVRVRKSTRIKNDSPGARKAAMIVAAELQKSLVSPEKRKVRKTLADAMKARMRALRVRSAPKNTVTRAQCAWDLHLLRLLGAETPCSSLTPQTLLDYADRRKNDGAAHDTVRRELVELRVAIRVAGETPPDMPELPPARVVERWTSAEEVQKLCDQLQPRRARVVQLIAQTGLRKTEVYRLERIGPGVGRLREIDGKEDGLKTGARTIPLTAEAERILLEGPLESWPNAGRDLPAAAERAGLGRVTFNDLRAGVATQLLIANVAPARIAALLGHTSLRMIERRYAKLKSLQVTIDDLSALAPVRRIPAKE